MQKQQLIENDQISSFIDIIVNDYLKHYKYQNQTPHLFLIKLDGTIQKLEIWLSHQIKNQSNEPILCSICITNKINISLSCNHQFCNDCLNMHIEEQLKYTCFPSCLYFQCNKIIPTIFYSHLEQFKNQIISSVQNNKKKCGNKKCLNLIENSKQKWFIRCQCGYLNCTLCQNGDHRPLSCAQAQKQYQHFSDLTEIKKYFSQNNYAQCPKCLVQIKKTFGCNVIK
ncbi:unnamed protein product [Paramecium sonneborni]|uniref:RBR-type E3 ubiquitin transferase n=1 Tax=Paramecium sonneborni TaxID=65129 RepID=A0A8S1MQD6_9CILI|nr:unnamed protein product [Paramecium sonneborni]